LEIKIQINIKKQESIFEGVEKSNWEKDGDEYYFHRFLIFNPI